MESKSIIRLLWPWGEVKRLNSEVESLRQEAASLREQLRREKERIARLPRSTDLSASLFKRVDELKQQLRESEEENENLRQQLRILQKKRDEAAQLPP